MTAEYFTVFHRVRYTGLYKNELTPYTEITKLMCPESMGNKCIHRSSFVYGLQRFVLILLPNFINGINDSSSLDQNMVLIVPRLCLLSPYGPFT